MPGVAAELTDLLAAAALLGGGAVTWRRSGSGRLMALAGAAWVAGDVSPSLLFAHRGPMVHLLVTFPHGGRPTRGAAVLVAVAYVDGLVPALAQASWPTRALAAAVLAFVAWRWRTAAG